MPSPLAKRRPAFLLLVPYLAVVARLTLFPAASTDPLLDPLRVFTRWLGSWGPDVPYAVVEAVANVALFVPFGVLVGVLLRRPWWAVALGAATSTGIELAQLLLLPSRVPTVQDVVMNTLGTAVGVAALLGARRMVQKRAGRALPEEDPARAAG